MPLLMCPNCQNSMQAIQRNGVEFDMCPTCRGVWLDRGELEKLVSLSASAEQPKAAYPTEQPRASYPSEPPPGEYPRARRYDDDDDDHRYGHKKKRGFDIFDIFD